MVCRDWLRVRDCRLPTYKYCSWNHWIAIRNAQNMVIHCGYTFGLLMWDEYKCLPECDKTRDTMTTIAWHTSSVIHTSSNECMGEYGGPYHIMSFFLCCRINSEVAVGGCETLAQRKELMKRYWHNEIVMVNSKVSWYLDVEMGGLDEYIRF